MTFYVGQNSEKYVFMHDRLFEYQMNYKQIVNKLYNNVKNRRINQFLVIIYIKQYFI